MACGEGTADQASDAGVVGGPMWRRFASREGGECSPPETALQGPALVQGQHRIRQFARTSSCRDDPGRTAVGAGGCGESGRWKAGAGLPCGVVNKTLMQIHDATLEAAVPIDSAACHCCSRMAATFSRKGIFRPAASGSVSGRGTDFDAYQRTADRTVHPERGPCMSFTWRYVLHDDGSFCRIGNIDGSLDKGVRRRTRPASPSETKTTIWPGPAPAATPNSWCTGTAR